MPNKTFSEEFKDKVTKEFIDARNKTAFAHEVGVSYNTLMKWQRSYKKDKVIEDIKQHVNEPTALTGVVSFKPNNAFNLHEGSLNDPIKEDFCRYMVFDTPLMNHLQSWLKANKIDKIVDTEEYDYYEQEARNWLNEPAISIRINKLISSFLLMNDQLADAQLSMMIMQNEDKKAKLKALELYYAITKRVERSSPVENVREGGVTTGLKRRLSDLLR